MDWSWWDGGELNRLTIIFMLLSKLKHSNDAKWGPEPE